MEAAEDRNVFSPDSKEMTRLRFLEILLLLINS